MAEIILITSFKGGVGKSTAAANLSAKLAKAGKNVLLCDLDFDLGTLDLITGCEDRMLFASDSPWSNAGRELETLFGLVGRGTFEKIAYLNAKKLLGL